MALTFFHIPRTGGSTVWHSLASAAARQNKIIADLYHQSRELTGGPYKPEVALQYFHDFLKKSNLCFDNDIIYHHHTHHHVPYLIESDQLQRVSLVRDPVTRLISEVFHIRRFLRAEYTAPATQQPSAEYELHQEIYGVELFEQLIATEVDVDALVLSYAQQGRNYYLSYFSEILRPHANSMNFDEAYALDLAQDVHSAFLWIGQFPELEQFISACGVFANLDISIELDMHHVANGSEVPALKEETLAQLKALHSLDYFFIGAVLQKYDTRLIQHLITNKEKLLSRHNEMIQDLKKHLDNQVHQAQLIEQKALSEMAATEKLAERLNHSEALIEYMQNSISWKLTAPLRAVRSRLKK